MGINKFAGVNLNNPEDIDIIESQWNTNCSLTRGKLKFQDYTKAKTPNITKIYEREYFNKGGGLEVTDYTKKGVLAFRKGNKYYQSGIPKPSVVLYFDYTKDKDNTAHYKVMLDSLYNDSNNGNGCISDGLYEAISNILPSSQMVAECEIAFSFSSPYGESGLTKFKISNYIPYFFAQISQFEDIKEVAKYVNVYVKYGFMTELTLVDRYEISKIPISLKSELELSLSKSIVKVNQLDFPILYDNIGPTDEVDSILYFSGFFNYSDETNPALKWFISSKLTSNLPIIDTEYQTYVADEDEFKDTDKYDALSEFYSADSGISTEEYKDTDSMFDSRSFYNVEIIDPNIGSEDTGTLSYSKLLYKNNMVSSSEAISMGNAIYELGGGSNSSYVSGRDSKSVIANQIAFVNSDAGDGMNNPDPIMLNIQFPKTNIGEQSIANTTTIKSDKRRDLLTTEVMIHKYIELEGARFLVDTYNYTTDGQVFDLRLRDVGIDNKFNGNGNAENYMFQVWIKNKTIDGSWLLVQHFTVDDLVKYTRGYGYNKVKIDDVFFNFTTDLVVPVTNEYEIGSAETISGQFDVWVSRNQEWAINGGHIVNGSDVSNQSVNSYGRLRKSEYLPLIATDIDTIYQLYFMGMYDSGATLLNHLGGFVNVAELMYDVVANRFSIYICLNPSVIINENLYLDSVPDIEDTIESVEYNYNELLQLVRYGVEQIFPTYYDTEEFACMKPKQTVSKHAEYMERLFKSIDEETTSLVYFSEQSYPESISPTSVFKFNDIVTHMETYRDKLYIFTLNEVKVLSGSNSLTFILDKYFTNGAYEYSVCQTDDVMLFTNSRGIYAVDGGYPKLISGKINRLFDEQYISVNYAEIVDTENGQYYVLNLTKAISPIDLNIITVNEVANITNNMVSLNNGIDAKVGDVDYDEMLSRFAIDKIAVSLRDMSIWFGSENTNEFMWKSCEIVQSSFFSIKSLKKMALDFSGRVRSWLTKNKREVVTKKDLPLTKAPESLGASDDNANKFYKGMPTEWNVNGERCYSYSVSFVSLDKKSILYKWELLEVAQ